ARHEDAVEALRKASEHKATHLPVAKLLAEQLAACGRFSDAIEVLEAAASAQPENPWYLLLAGKFYRSLGKPAEAASAFQKATALNSQLVAAWEGLVAARLEEGKFKDASAATDWLHPVATDPAGRNAQFRQMRMCRFLVAMADRIPAYLARKDAPTEPSAQCDLAAWCLKHKRLTATAAHFYESAFSAEPKLADDLVAGDRFHAACAAALAGCGIGADAGELGADKRAVLRKQALDRLTADFNAWEELHRVAKPGQRTMAAAA